MHGRRLFIVLVLVSQAYWAPQANAQVELERGVRVTGLWCFPLFQKPNEWVYIPATGQLAVDEQQNPRFSLVTYAFNQTNGGDSSVSITQADGGAILHFLVLYNTPAAQVADAQRELRRLFDNKDLLLKGPMLFNAGRYTLISSIVGQDGENQRHVLATGSAPVLEGNQLALSFQLAPQQAMLLMQSFQTATPDISIVFDLSFTGVTDAYQAKVHVDWSEMRQNQAFSAGGTVYWISADVEAEIDRLIRNNAIRMESVGSDTETEALVARIYEKILELLFTPAVPEQVPTDQRGGMMQALDALIGRGGLLSSGQTTGFGAHVGYQLKDLRSEGVTVLDFNHRDHVERHAYVTFNIGDLYRRYGDNPRYFRRVVPTDPTFNQREIQVTVDGALLPEFKQLVNSVTLALRKQHDSGQTTVQERVINRASLTEDTQIPPMVYGWKGDQDRIAWLDYEYRTRWSFKGGGSYETPWTANNAAMIDLYAPYERRRVQIVNGGGNLAQAGVRAIIINIQYPFFGNTRREQIVIRADQAEQPNTMDITLPRNIYEYDYQMTWIMQNGQRPSISGHDSSGLIFLDPPPVDTD